jgi:hypothetical protein
VAALATRHAKQDLIAPALAELGLEIVVADVDTDRFGTFTGEIPRRASAHDVVLAKARAAIEGSGLEIGLASEGSFGPHPVVPALTADVELVALVDLALDLVVVESAISLATAAASVTVAPGEDLRDFCRGVGFPDQALIARPARGPSTGHLTKGIVDEDELADAVARAAHGSLDGRALVETDLRAHLCPTRRPVIAEAATRLASRLRRACPACARPGFGERLLVPGLACALCGLATDEVRATIESCPRCDYRESRPVNGRADPSRCARCNP